MALIPARAARVRMPKGPEDEGKSFVWTRRDAFGPWLRECRKKEGYSLRKAAEHLGVPFTKLQKMETNGRYKAPSLEFLADLGALYRVAATEVYAQAGIRVVEPEAVAGEVDFEGDFEAIVLHPPIRPAGMDEPWLDFFSLLQKQQWLHLARGLEQLIRREGREVVEAIMADGPPEAMVDDGATPEDLGFTAQGDDRPRLVSGVLYYWQFTPDFGPWLREQREQEEVSLRDVSRELEVPFSMLQRLETEEEERPRIRVLELLAVFLNIPLRLLFKKAGYRRRSLRDLFGVRRDDRDFAALVLHPKLRPVRMDPRAVRSWSGLQKLQFIEFAGLLEDWILEDGGSLSDVLSEEG